MARAARVSTCHSVIVLLACWISAVHGSNMSVPCTQNNCTSARVGEPCSSPADCLAITSSQCRDDTCQCISGYMPRNESRECGLRTISDQCQIDSDCADAIANSFCHRNRMCRCLDGYLFEGSNCVARQLDDKCAKNSDCTEVMNNTRCVGKTCACINLYLREDNNTCRPRRLGDNCTKNVECTPAQFKICFKGLCGCAKGYRQTASDVLGDSSCVKVTLGSRCSKSPECSHIPYSECGTGPDRRCQCARRVGRRASANNETCDVIQLHDDCLSDVDCQNVNNSVCVGGKCSCRSGYAEDVPGVSCKQVLLGDPCGLDSDCSMAKTFCSNKICSCVKGFSFSSNGSSQCTQMVVEDTECSRPEDCLEHFPNTVCKGMGLCHCQLRYYLSASGSQCLFRYVGDSCNNDGECRYSVEYTECNHNICKCIDTHLPSTDKTECDLKILGGMPCRTDATCLMNVSHSSCDVNNSSTCFCNTGYSSNERFDLCQDKRLSEPCWSDAECNTTNPNTLCSPVTQRCECFPEFVPTFPESVNTTSKPFCSRRKIGDQSCQAKEDCLSAIANSTCGSCREAPGGSPCLQRCDESSNVTAPPGVLSPGSRCPEQTCICQRGFLDTSDGERCEARKLRDPCRVDEDCSALIPDTVCLTGRNVCVCALGFREGGSDVCTKQKIGDTCNHDIHCEPAVPFSYCNISNPSVCKCKSGYHANDAGTECRKRQIGDRTCQVNEDCSDAVNNSKCHQPMCVCVIGYYRSVDHTQCIKRKLYDDYCDDNRDCSAVIPNAVCGVDFPDEFGRCICPSGYYSDNGTECKKRNINDSCTPGVLTDCSDAVGNSTCFNGACVCVSGFFAVGSDSCQSRRINDSNCENLHDCADAVGNSSCKNGVCLCDTGYYASAGGTVCLQRQLNDTCNETSDCDSVIDNSHCVTERCECMEGFDVQASNGRCVPRPAKIGDLCYFLQQCHRVDPVSICDLTEGSRWTCLCPPWTFTALDNSSCLKYPEKLGDFCQRNEQCSKAVGASKCELNNNTCVCHDSYIQYNATSCVEIPNTLGDFCLADVHCTMTMEKSKCEQDNNTCVCEYGYTQKTSTLCGERDRLPQYEPINGSESVTCQADKCTNWTNSRCEEVKGMPDKLCRCDFRHALPYNSTHCVPIQTYQVDLSLTREAGTYDYLPLDYMHEYSLNRTPIYTKFADRVTMSGLMMLFNKTSLSSSLKDRYVASDVLRFQNLSMTSQATGVKATLLLHLTANYMDATPSEDIYNFIEEYLHGSDGLLGQSALKLATPYSGAVVITDYDECGAVNGSDCSDHATCINTLGSFMCVCNYRYEDVSKSYNRRPGRVCNIPSTTDETSDLCSSDDCKTRWEFVGLAVTLFLLIVMAFITYEIIQRKKTFTARKLYEKFGTTKIRKLRQASMQRLHERKKRKKAENKIKKEEEKQKKEELKREKSQKKRLKDEERKAKLEDKKQKDLEKKDAKRAKLAKSSDDVEWLGEEEDREPPSPAAEPGHPDTTDDSPSGSLPGSVNDPEIEMIFPKITTSTIEESNV